MEEIAEQISGETSELLERWDGRPDLIAEDIFRARNHNTGEIEDLELFRPYQTKFLHAYFYGDATTLNVYKGRRIGFSFIVCVSILIDAMLHEESFYAIVSRSKSQAKDRIEDIYDLIENAKVDFDLPTDNRDEIELSNGATIRAFSGSPNTSRGADAAQTVFVDEMAFLDDQDETMRAFRPFISLGDAQMVQVSTPRTKNDRFLKTHRRGTPDGSNGTISIKQPSFKNAEEIDPQQSLVMQDAEPVRPDMNIQAVEDERAEDPEGFAQEYLCRPVSDEYRFFSSETIREAAQRGEQPDYKWGEYTAPQNDGFVVLAADLATKSDDTAVAVVEHHGERRSLRYHEKVTNKRLKECGIPNADRANPDHVAQRISQLYEQLHVDYVIYDQTGCGEAFRSDIQNRVGRGAQGFNFTDKDAVDEMMKNLNYGFHNDLINLIDDSELVKQLEAIVKKQTNEYQKPKYSGKDHAPDGKDDIAMALALASYPPTIDTTNKPSMKQRNNVSQKQEDVETTTSSGFSGVKLQSSRRAHSRDKQTYSSRYSRNRKF